MAKTNRIAVIGLGYVGLPRAMALARRHSVVGFDIDTSRIEELRRGVDRTREVVPERLKASSLRLTADEREIEGADLFMVTVPTPVDGDKEPDLSALEAACEIVGRRLRPGAIVVFESTVYPGAGHGFFCDARGSYNEAAAKDAWPKTLAFFAKNLRG